MHNDAPESQMMGKFDLDGIAALQAQGWMRAEFTQSKAEESL